MKSVLQTLLTTNCSITAQIRPCESEQPVNAELNL